MNEAACIDFPFAMKVVPQTRFQVYDQVSEGPEITSPPKRDAFGHLDGGRSPKNGAKVK
jgi:hypothetical protein